MDCLHCVAKDFGPTDDLVITQKLLDWINKSPFMVVVITGGEPLLPGYENQLITLLRKIQGRGLIVDTNGTIFPSESVVKAILETHTLVRISWDSPRSYDETYFRRTKSDTKPHDAMNLECYHKKIAMIRRFQTAGVNVSVQTVVQKRNRLSVLDMPRALRELSIDRWYLQRFIPSHKVADKNFGLSNDEYGKITGKLMKICREVNIECVTKKDRRHNCVVLLVGDGILYTQGERPRQKIRLGTIHDNIEFFQYVSSADHAERYYL
jgi:MoaA/NifB/PqqE/SkfB family radical SAM enzyme